MFRSTLRLTAALAVATLVAIIPRAALAQGSDRPLGFLSDLFGGSQRVSPDQPPAQAQPAQSQPTQTPSPGRVAQGPGGELSMRIDRLEAQIRQLTGAIETLQHRNQQLEDQLRRLRAGEAAVVVPLAPQQGQMQPQVQPQIQPQVQPQAQPQVRPPASPSQSPPPGRRGEVFDPAQNPNAPGAPRVLGTISPSGAAAQPLPNIANDEVGAPGGRAAGAPLDLSTLAGVAPIERAPAQPGVTAVEPLPAPRTPGGPGAQVATLPPSDSPKDNFDLAYGYVLRKDYALAEDGFRGFLRRFPSDRLVPDAHYWLGESMFQRQQYRDAAEAFLLVSTKYESNARAPESLLRLGQSLAAMGEREAACASLAEVLRKYPRVTVAIRQGVEREQKRVRC
jgi:tol-pal system protein YbgF